MPGLDKNDFYPLPFVIIGVASFVLSYGALPEIVPIHFGLGGQPDGWAPKVVALMVPALAVFLYLSLAIGRAWGRYNLPWKLNDSNRVQLVALCREFLLVLNVMLSAFLAYLQWAMIQVAMQRIDGIGVWFAPVFIGAILVVYVVYYLRGNGIFARSAS